MRDLSMSNEIVTPTIELIALLEAAGFVRNAKSKITKGGRFKPKDGDRYYTLLADGSPRLNIWEGSNTDNNHYALGNCYRTVAEVTATRNSKLALVRVQDKLEELTDDPLDWGNFHQNKYKIHYGHPEGVFGCMPLTVCQTLEGLYGSKSACNWVIYNMESDLKLIVGVV